MSDRSGSAVAPRSRVQSGTVALCYPLTPTLHCAITQFAVDGCRARVTLSQVDPQTLAAWRRFLAPRRPIQLKIDLPPTLRNFEVAGMIGEVDDGPEFIEISLQFNQLTPPMQAQLKRAVSPAAPPQEEKMIHVPTPPPAPRPDLEAIPAPIIPLEDIPEAEELIEIETRNDSLPPQTGEWETIRPSEPEPPAPPKITLPTPPSPPAAIPQRNTGLRPAPVKPLSIGNPPRSAPPADPVPAPAPQVPAASAPMPPVPNRVATPPQSQHPNPAPRSPEPPRGAIPVPGSLPPAASIPQPVPPAMPVPGAPAPLIRPVVGSPLRPPKSSILMRPPGLANIHGPGPALPPSPPPPDNETVAMTPAKPMPTPPRPHPVPTPAKTFMPAVPPPPIPTPTSDPGPQVAMPVRSRKLGEVLVQMGRLSAVEADDAVRMARQAGEKLGRFLMRRGMLPPDVICRALALQSGLPMTCLDDPILPEELQKIFPLPLMQRHTCVPFDESRALVLTAAANPLSPGAVKELERACGRKVEMFLAREDLILKQLDHVKTLFGGEKKHKSRKFIRYEVKVPLLFQFVTRLGAPADPIRYDGSTMNLSEGGMLIEGPPAKLGAPDELRRRGICVSIQIPFNAYTIVALCQLRGVKPRQDPQLGERWCYGIEIVDMTADNRRHLKELCVKAAVGELEEEP